MSPRAFSQVVAAAVAATGALAATSGDFNVLTMNVAGLPAFLQGNGVPGDKTTNSRLVGSKFAQYGYDIIHVQEDFNYHAAIYETDNHPERTATSGGIPFGDGLNTLSNFPWLDHSRTKWNKCDLGSGDCLTPKGYSFMRVRLDEGVYVDTYNLHADAGTGSGDLVARRSNIQQLSDAINVNSAGNAVLVFGDTNTRYSRTEDNIRLLRTASGMTDVWVELVHNGIEPPSAPGCANPSTDRTCEIVDKVFYRGGALVNMQATFWNYEGPKFLQPDGNVLSDHDPVTANFTWSSNPKLRASDLFGGVGGEWFTDAVALAAKDRPKTATIRLRGNARVDKVSVTLTDGTTFWHGGDGGNEVVLNLAADEFWTGAEICQGTKDRLRVFYLSATTSKGRTAVVGARTSECRAFTAPNGWQIVGFVGRAWTEVDKLSFVYAPQ